VGVPKLLNYESHLFGGSKLFHFTSKSKLSNKADFFTCHKANERQKAQTKVYLLNINEKLENHLSHRKSQKLLVK
jgi:hypothetical protein